MEDSRRHWIAKCVIGEIPSDYTLGLLSGKGYSENEIFDEIEAAEKNPCIYGALDEMNCKLAKASGIGFYTKKVTNNQTWLLERY